MANAFIGRKRIIYWTLATDAAKFVGTPMPDRKNLRR